MGLLFPVYRGYLLARLYVFFFFLLVSLASLIEAWKLWVW